MGSDRKTLALDTSPTTLKSAYSSDGSSPIEDGEIQLRVIVADGVRLFRQGVALLLSQTDRVRVVAATGGVDDTVRAARQHRPGVVLLGSHLAHAESFSTTRQLARALPAVKVVILTPVPNRYFLAEAARAGAAGVVCDTVDNLELVDIVWAVHRGEALRSAHFIPLPDGKGRRGAGGGGDHLGVTEQELRVLARLVEGHSNGEIARSLSISLDTVKSHLKHLYGKLGVRSRTEAAVVGLRWGLLDGGLAAEGGSAAAGNMDSGTADGSVRSETARFGSGTPTERGRAEEG